MKVSPRQCPLLGTLSLRRSLRHKLRLKLMLAHKRKPMFGCVFAEHIYRDASRRLWGLGIGVAFYQHTRWRDEAGRWESFCWGGLWRVLKCPDGQRLPQRWSLSARAWQTQELEKLLVVVDDRSTRAMPPVDLCPFSGGGTQGGAVFVRALIKEVMAASEAKVVRKFGGLPDSYTHKQANRAGLVEMVLRKRLTRSAKGSRGTAPDRALMALRRDVWKLLFPRKFISQVMSVRRGYGMELNHLLQAWPHRKALDGVDRHHRSWMPLLNIIGQEHWASSAWHEPQAWTGVQALPRPEPWGQGRPALPWESGTRWTQAVLPIFFEPRLAQRFLTLPVWLLTAATWCEEGARLSKWMEVRDEETSEGRWPKLPVLVERQLWMTFFGSCIHLGARPRQCLWASLMQGWRSHADYLGFTGRGVAKPHRALLLAAWREAVEQTQDWIGGGSPLQWHEALGSSHPWCRLSRQARLTVHLPVDQSSTGRRRL